MSPEAAASGEPPGSAGATASRGVLGRGSIYTIGTAAPILANAAVVPFVTRLLVREYGVVAIAIVVLQVAMMAGSFGMPSVITRQGIISLGGSTSGEHNDGRLRAPFLERVYGKPAYELFQKVK